MTIVANTQRNELVIKFEKEYLARASFSFISKTESHFDCSIAYLYERITQGKLKATDALIIIKLGIEAAGSTITGEELEQAVEQFGSMGVLMRAMGLLQISFAGPKVNKPKDEKKVEIKT